MDKKKKTKKLTDNPVKAEWKSQFAAVAAVAEKKLYNAKNIHFFFIFLTSCSCI